MTIKGEIPNSINNLYYSSYACKDVNTKAKVDQKYDINYDDITGGNIDVMLTNCKQHGCYFISSLKWRYKKWNCGMTKMFRIYLKLIII